MYITQAKRSLSGYSDLINQSCKQIEIGRFLLHGFPLLEEKEVHYLLRYILVIRLSIAGLVSGSLLQ